MKFLCDHHRCILSSCTKQAKRSWQKTLHLAQFYAANSEWDRAVLYSGNSLEIAEIILTNQPSTENAKRYVETSTEFAYALACYEPDCNLLAVYNSVYHCLFEAHLAADIDLLMKPLTAVLHNSNSIAQIEA
jgi:hypothetical protein